MAFNKEKGKSNKSILQEAINVIHDNNPVLNAKDSNAYTNKIVDIMTFCNDPRYLDLAGAKNNFRLWTSQRAILKCFYSGTMGNETSSLSEEEWKWLIDNAEDEEIDGVLYEKNVDEVIKKMEKRAVEGFTFKELHLVLGRRSSKTVLASIISAYEIYKLLTIGDGDPHAFYGLPYGEEIAVINVALSQEQAGRLFTQVEARVRNSPFFAKRIANATTKELRFYTNRDLKDKEGGEANIKVNGSVFILCGHSNPDTLRGHNVITLLFDELAFYDETGKVSGKYFYETLAPSLSKFKPFGHQRVVAISSPAGERGIFFDLFKQAKTTDEMLSFQLPTWKVNPELTYKSLESDRKRNPETFMTEYGAQWTRGGAYGTFFPPDLIDRIIRVDLTPHTKPKPGVNYYLHIDPASNGNRYVAVMVAKEYYASNLGRRRIRVYLANTWVWEALPGIGVQFHTVDKEVIQICSIFHPLAVGYDQYNSMHSLQLLRSHGINCIQTAYNRGYKNKIYQNLLDMMSYEPKPELYIYNEPRLILEMKCLKKRPTLRGISLVTDKFGEVKTDDIVDCLAGATAMASENIRAPLPTAVLVRTNF